MSFDVEQLFQAVDIILTQRLDNISYDTTMICTIVEDKDKDKGQYIVSDGSIKFDAYTNDNQYKIGDQVRVSILNGDFTARKFIEGKYIGNDSNVPIIYSSPTSTTLSSTENLVLQKSLGEKIQPNISDFIIYANNGQETYKPLWKVNLNKNDKYYKLQSNGIYNVITLSADFETDLGELKSGNYGLELNLLIQTEFGSEYRIRRFMTLDSQEMIGNPYTFKIASHQEKKVNIATEGIITEILLSAYQGIKINDDGSYDYSPFINMNDEVIEQKPIKIKNINLQFGSDLSKVENKTLQLYTTSPLTYKYYNPTQETNNKNLGLIWYNKTDNNEYVGFKDGIYDPDYDEIYYRKENSSNSRLMAQKDKVGIASDEQSLTLAANIEDAKPLIRNSYELLTTDLSQELQALSRQLMGTAFLPGQVGRDENDTILGLNRLIKTQANNIAVLVDLQQQAEKTAFKLYSQYSQILNYGYNVQNSLEDENIWNKDSSLLTEEEWNEAKDNGQYPNYNSYQDYLNDNGINWNYDYYSKDLIPIFNLALSEVRDFFTSMNRHTLPNEPLSGCRGIYDTYFVRVERQLNILENNLSQIKKLLDDDFHQLLSYQTKDNYIPYHEKDLSEYNNKYCLYWYRYKKGFVLSYEKDSENNDEYFYGNFAGDNWERIPLELNFGLPQDPGEIIDNITYCLARAVPEKILQRTMEPRTQEERYKVILFYNHDMIESNIITFTNIDDVPDEFLVDKNDFLRIEHDVSSQEHYSSYSSANDLINISDGSIYRQLKCFYEGVLSGDETLAEAGLYWYVPINSTMLTFDKDYLLKQGFTTDLEEKTVYSRNGYVYFYKKVGSKKVEEPILDFEGNPALNDDNTPITQMVTKSVEADRYFFYKIKSYYEHSAQNNTIEVYAYIPNVVEPIKGEITFTFSTAGNNGTKYSFAITPLTEQIAVLPETLLDLEISLRNANNELLTLNGNENDESTEELVTYGLNVNWYASNNNKNKGNPIINDIPQSKTKKITVPHTTDDNKYLGIIEAKTSFQTEGINEATSRQITLNTLYSIPYASNNNFYISGPTVIVYNNQGTLSRLSEEPFCLYQHVVQEGDNPPGDIKVENQQWSLIYYDSLGNVLNLNDKNDEIILSYMPRLNSDNTIMPAPMYYSYNDGEIFYVPVAICKIGESIVWTQPIIITQNQYASSTLNDWNGQFEINEANGTIMSTMIGAGTKNEDNTFSGVLMGNIETGANFDTDNASGLGIYGIHQGSQSFNFNVDGTAFLGKAGRGRIKFDGNKGQISSASYQQNRIPIKDDDGKIIGYDDFSTAGMLIDLDDGYIDMKGTSIEDGEYVPKMPVLTKDEWESLEDSEYSSYQSYLQNIETEYIKSYKQSKIHIDVKNPYLTIHSANQPENNKYIMYVGDDKYYLQSDKYIKANFDTSIRDLDNANNLSPGEGMLIDLYNGSINAYNLTVASKNIFLNAGDNANPYFSIRDNNGKVIFYAGDNNYFLKSSDFVTQNGSEPGMGTKIDLKEGSFEAYNKFVLKAGNTNNYNSIITISSKGSTNSPYLSIRTQNDVEMIHFSETQQFIQSYNFDQNDQTGLNIDLSKGSIIGYNFTLQAVSGLGEIILSSKEESYPFQVIGTTTSDGNYSYDSDTSFKIGWNGVMYATGGVFSGEINAKGGTFSGDITATGRITGGAIIGAALAGSSIVGGTLDIGGNVSVDSNASQQTIASLAGKGAFSVDSSGNIRIGSQSNPTFTVDNSGHLTSESATIGGWHVGPTEIWNDNGVSLVSSANGVVGGIESEYFNVGEDGKTRIKNLIIEEDLTFESPSTVNIDTYTVTGCDEPISIVLDTPWSLSPGCKITIYKGFITEVTSGSDDLFDSYKEWQDELTERLDDHESRIIALEDGLGTLEDKILNIQDNLIEINEEIASVREDMATEDAAIREDMATEDAAIRTDMATEDAAIRTDMATENAAIRTEMATEDAAIRTDMATENAAIRTDMATEITSVRTDMAAENVAIRTEMATENAAIRADMATEDAAIREAVFAEIADIRADMATSADIQSLWNAINAISRN